MGKIHVDVVDIEKFPLDTQRAVDFVEDGSHGAVDIFIGKVRNHNLGREVDGVSYDVFIPLAKASFFEICQDAKEKWGDDLNLYVEHGKGRLNIGGISILIAASSPHRDEAFQACRYIIEEIKHRSPIWKKEHYVDGDSDWVKGHALCSHH